MNAKKHGLSWIISANYHDDCKTYISGDFKGIIRIQSSSAEYTMKIGKMINKVLFKPNEGSFMKAAIATRGKGVILIDAATMDYDPK